MRNISKQKFKRLGKTQNPKWILCKKLHYSLSICAKNFAGSAKGKCFAFFTCIAQLSNADCSRQRQVLLFAFLLFGHWPSNIFFFSFLYTQTKWCWLLAISVSGSSVLRWLSSGGGGGGGIDTQTKHCSEMSFALCYILRPGQDWLYCLILLFG